MDLNWSEDVRKLSHVALVMAAVAFSLALVVLGIVFGWETWTIPVVIVGGGVCLTLHVARIASEHERLVVYSIILLLELFYYSVKAGSVYDITPVIAIMIVLFAMTGNKSLIYFCIAVGYAGMVFHLIEASKSTGLDLSMRSVFRTVGHFILVMITGLVTLRLMDYWKKMGETYLKRVEKATEENQKISNFLVNVSHEVRTPVNAVVGISTVMLKRAEDEEVRKDLRSIQDAGRRVAEQVGDILDFTEIDMDKLVVSNESYMLASLVNDVIAEHPARTLGDCELIFDVDTSVPTAMVGDSVKIKKILHHLIDNAVKFSQKGGVYVRVHSEKRPYGVNLCIDVTDTGIGMTKSELEHIYDSFYQSDSGRSRMAGGLGLGLTIVRGMVDRMKGFITINSVYGEGTTVSISIPQEVVDKNNCISIENNKQLCIAGFIRLEKLEVPRVREFYSELIGNMSRGLGLAAYMVKNTEELELLRQTYGLTHIFVGEEEFVSSIDYLEPLSTEISVIVIASESFRLLPGAAIRVLYKPFSCFTVASMLCAETENDVLWDETRQLSTPGLEVLVVDDEPMNLLVAEGIFREYGMNVETARSGPEAIEKCREKQYDVVFMDHMMPEMDGVEAMKAIRDNAGKKDAQSIMIALTANAVSGAREMFISEGFDGFVAKPIEITELERVLKRVLPKSSISFDAPGLQEARKEPDKSAAPKRETAESLFSRLEAVGVNTVGGMHYCRNDPAFYRMLLGEFEKNADDRLIQFREQYRNKDWKNYAVNVHALKSTSAMIGAEKLSEIAAFLENAAKRRDEAAIGERHEEMLAKLAEVLSAFKSGVEQESIEPVGEEIMEFDPAGDDEIMEFAPAEDGGEQGGRDNDQ
ncbi:MAG: response regulator [Oscillospiraceae bacterium]|nr:response regulator [Oscillospiraceae bacterium]